MELFSLLAKLTLDSKDFDKGLDDAQKKADGFEAPEEQRLELDTSEYDSGISESESLSTGFTSSVGSAFGELKGVIAASGVALAVAGIVNGLKEAVNLTAETADEIDKGSKRLGISTEKYQSWNHALKQSGASITDLQKGILLFNKAMTGDATDDVKEAFASLEIDPETFKSSEELVEATLKKLSELPHDENRMNLVTALFGRGGTSLNALLDEGREGVEQLLSEAEGLGLIMSDDEINNAVAYGDAVENLQSELQAIQTAFVADLMPVLKEAVDWLTQLLQLFNPRLRDNSLSETFETINKGTTESLENLKQNKAEAEALIEKLGAMGDFWTLSEEDKQKYNALVEELKKLYPELNEVIDKNSTAIYDNKNAILANIDAWTAMEQQRLLSDNIAKKREAVAEKYAKALDKETEAEVKEAEAEGKKATAIEAVNDILKKNQQLQSAVYSAYGVTELNKDNADEILKFIREKGFDTVGMDTVDEFVKLEDEAEKLRKEAKGMEEEADQAQQELTKYSEALAKKLGITLTDTTKVKEEIQALKQELNSMPPGIRVTVDMPNALKPYAIGSPYIPYDQPAMLHRGERVLTATENRRGEGQTFDFSGLEDKIIAAIKAGMDGVEVNSYLDGTLVTEKVSRNLASQMADRRYV